MVCHPPPPPLAAVVSQATALVSRHVAPVDAPRACLDDDVPRGSGQATPGTVWLAESDRAVYARPAHAWPADRHVALLHEVLHQVGMRQDLQVEQLADEEALAEAVAQDLRPVWLRRQIGHDARVAIAYRPGVAAIRRASARATDRTWTSAAARRWRMTLLALPPAARAPALAAVSLPAS